jgi:hypothetical protein
MRQLEGLCSLRHGEIMCVFPSVPLPAILLELLDLYSKLRDSKLICSCFLGGVSIKFNPWSRVRCPALLQFRVASALQTTQLLPPEPDWACSST